VEKANYFVADGIDAGNIWSFETIAVDAGQSEIFKLSFAPMLSRNDVIDWKWCWIEGGGQPTVFATIFPALPDPANEIGVQECLTE
jgi:hypothetical protein